MDIVFLGPRFILTEFLIGVIGSVGVGVFGLLRPHTIAGTLLCTFLIFLGINYVPPMVYAIDVVWNGSAHQEIADELPEKQKMFRKYRRQSLLLLVPLVVPILALVQGRASARSHGGRSSWNSEHRP